ncbi:hypothetical protein MBLNU459_g7687t1 [Dothideomycetes sp. NU459]
MDPVESPAYGPESPTDEDEIFTCKGCGEILEQGRAFELAGHRWHLSCFRCHSCGTLLDSDANLLLLGDGSLICNNCTYSCSSCGNKIEDLAILTGDQAFCATCFKCRNCKRKIENLRYARTSQGIFCMTCHESLMARRRKKSKASKLAAASASNPIVLDKSLPALPPNAVPQNALRSVETPPSDTYTDTPTERSPRRLKAVRDGTNGQRDVSPLSEDSKTPNYSDTLTLPASTYKEERASTVSSMNTSEADDDRALFPLAFDPSPVPGPPPLSNRRQSRKDEMDSTPRLKENLSPNDYFGGRASSKTQKENLGAERPSSSRSASTERDAHLPKATSPHIAYQEKGRQPKHRNTSGNTTPASSSVVASPSSASAPAPTSDRLERPRMQQTTSGSLSLQPPSSEPFRLQEVPRDRKASRSNARTGNRSPTSLDVLNSSRYQPSESTLSLSPALDTPNSGINPFDDPKLREAAANAGPASTRHPAREDSLPPSTRKPVPTRSDGSSKLTSPDSTPTMHLEPAHERQQSGSSTNYEDAPTHIPADIDRTAHQPLDPSSKIGQEVPTAPPRAASRPSAPRKSVANDDFASPRGPPPPPAERERTESVSTTQSDLRPGELPSSPPAWRGHLPKHSIGGDFSMEEEMARILRGEEKEKADRKRENSESSSSMLRRVSNAVKHGRSFSDRAVPLTQRTPTLGGMEISSPIPIGTPISSPSMKDDVASLKSQLRRAQHKIAELEATKVGLEDKVNNSADIKQVNTELREKRSTMAFLDTQREMVVRELEIMTEHLSKAKDSNKPLDFQSLKSEVLQDFARSLEKLKDTIGAQIEDLVHKRNELTDDIGSLIQVKDKGLQEFESLSQKNHQLLEMNQQLVANIQDMYKANRLPSNASLDRSPLTNGLGIYTGGRTDMSSLDTRSGTGNGSIQESGSLSNLLQEAEEAAPATILTAPQVVNIRKGQPKKFNWKKGSSGLTKSVTKGLKGAFAGGADRMPINPQTGSYEQFNGIPYSQMQAGPGAIMGDQPLNARHGSDKGGFGFFSSDKKTGLKPGVMGQNMKNSSATNLAAESASVLFGSDLSERCDFEKRVIPSIVTRCIDEVELRGMDVEGVYRKSGGSGQVKIIQQGFEKDGQYDISDPDLDIHAVTSALKQYFRKLPNPLITYEAYDSLLEAGQVADKEKQGAAMKAALDNLPQGHRDVLEYLVLHLCRVVKQESQNLMTPLNLSVVFAPTIMRPLSIEREMSDMQAQRMAVQALLEHASTMFDTD